MADLIDRGKLLDWFSAYVLCNELIDAETVIEDIRSAKSVDAVEVVRCRECIHAVEIEKDYIRKLFIDGTKQ